ncbi:MAG: hypothetical protein ACR2OR_15625 [Hyphomicrobiales bacterium]
MIIRFAIVLVVLVFAPAAHAGAPDGYVAGFEKANAHLRAAASYLRTQNPDLAAIELEEFNAAWENLPAVSSYARNEGLFSQIISAAATSGENALSSVDAGELEKARRELLTARASLYALHTGLGWEIFADCIWRANETGKALWPFRRPPPDLEDESVREEIKSASNAYLEALEACDAKAPSAIKIDPEFRRLIDGSVQSLQKLPSRVDEKSTGGLFRLLIELRSFDRLLYFRFG